MAFNHNGIHSKLTWTPVRVVVRPWLVHQFKDRWKNQLGGVFLLYVKETVVGPLTGSGDFGEPSSTFSSGRELKTSAGFTLDLMAAVGIFTNRK
jgi:hypothetical protein